MNEAVDGGAARIHFDLARLFRDNPFNAPGQCIVDLHYSVYALNRGYPAVALSLLLKAWKVPRIHTNTYLNIYSVSYRTSISHPLSSLSARLPGFFISSNDLRVTLPSLRKGWASRRLLLHAAWLL